MITDSGSSFTPPPVGAHIAVLTRIVDLGTQEGEYPPGSGEKNFRKQQMWTWELPHELMEDGQPFVISKFYTKSLGEKANLTKDLTSWLGKTPTVPFDDEALLGKACQVIVSGREGTDKVRVTGVAPISKGTEIPKTPHNPLIYFSLDDGKFDQDVYSSFSDWVQSAIAKSPEYIKAVSGEDFSVDEEVSEENIPF